MKPGEKAEMPVVFYIDPAIVKDSEQNDLNSITLSYTFFPVREPPRAVSVNAATPAPGRL
jgi:cytochrome c oxidase assembly protein subunit 11